MATRLCGYCRQIGHRADACESKLTTRNEILTYVPRERKSILDLMVKNGWGEGATFIHWNMWHSRSETYMLTNADFIKYWQFGSQKKVKYSKQLNFIPLSPVERMKDGQIADARYQYDSLRIRVLGFGGSNSGLTEYRLPVRCIVKPTMFTGENLDHEPKLIEASYTPFDVDPQLYVEDIMVHRRVAQSLSRRTSNWDNVYYETGILPS